MSKDGWIKMVEKDGGIKTMEWKWWNKVGGIKMVELTWWNKDGGIKMVE